MVTRRSIVLSGLAAVTWACGNRRRRGAEAAPGPKPGEPMMIRGRVLRADGRTPAAGVMVYVYHTAMDGLYGLEPGAPPRHRGWMQADRQGRFGYESIVPASYPGGKTAAHVHYQLWGGGVPTQWSSTFFVDRAPRLRRDARGVWRVEHELRAKARGDVLVEGIRHGVRDAPRSAPARIRIVAKG